MNSSLISNVTNNAPSLVDAITNCIGTPGCKIPIEVTSTVASNWNQFYVSLALSLLGSFFLLFFLWTSLLAPMFSSMMIKINLNSLKKKTGRNMIIMKHTSQGMFDMSMINQKTLLQMTKAMNKFAGADFDLVLHTPGGEIFSSMFISRLLKEYPGKIRVIVPYYAMSGGTLLALSGHEIYMSQSACLGPVDPQLGNLFKYGSAKSWDKILKLKGKRAEDSSISFAYMGQQYTKSIASYINELLVDRMSAKDRIAFVKFLTYGAIEHSYPLTINALNKFGLKTNLLDNATMNKLNKIISSKLYEGIYSI